MGTWKLTSAKSKLVPEKAKYDVLTRAKDKIKVTVDGVTVLKGSSVLLDVRRETYQK